jgi:DNA-binding response OmpR family regulator
MEGDMPHHGSPYGSPKGTILVADDNECVREPLTELLRTQGYRVISVADGEQAFREICSRSVDLALLDVMMPGQTGFAVCREIKARPETCLVPVVLITGLTNADDRIHGIEAGADDFLSKPVKKEELLARVRSLVRLKRITDELESAESVVFMLARAASRQKIPTRRATATGFRATPCRSRKSLDCAKKTLSRCAAAESFMTLGRWPCQSPSF